MIGGDVCSHMVPPLHRLTALEPAAQLHVGSPHAHALPPGPALHLAVRKTACQRQTIAHAQLDTDTGEHGQVVKHVRAHTDLRTRCRLLQ